MAVKLSYLLENTQALHAACPLDAEITDICHDSRKVKPGAAFVAIRGFKLDGNGFIPSAMEKGAAVVITDVKPEREDFPYIYVPDARIALAQMSEKLLGSPQKSLKLIAVTGTKGKTTAAWLIHQIISAGGAKCGYIGTIGTLIPGLKMAAADRTTPESLELFKLFAHMQAKGCEYCVLEISSHSICLDRIHGLEFECAVFTNLSQDHLDFHENMENYYKAKARLFKSCKTAVVNIDDEYGLRLASEITCERITFSGKSNAADLVAKNIKLKSGGVEFEAVMRGAIERLTLAIPGMFSVLNALGATGACAALGLGLEAAAAALPRVSGVPGRVEVVPVAADFTVIIDYAHSPAAIENVLTAIRGFTKGRIIALTGCGGDRDRTKRPIMGETAARLSDVCVITSDNPRSEDPWAIIDDIVPGARKHNKPLHIIEDRREAIALALTIAREGDVVALLGKGHETYQEISGKKHHLDEREVVAEFFASR